MIGLTVGCTSSPASPSAASSAPGAQATSGAAGENSAPSGPTAAASAATRSGTGVLSVPKARVSSVKAWDSGPGGAALKVVSGQVGVALQAVGLRQYAAARGACVKLAAGVSAARAGAPIPDAAMQHLYQTALADLGRGAANCQASISKGHQYFKTPQDAQTLRRSMSTLSAGADDLYRATGDIDALKRTD
ncbi:MAG TPA: hypothetical protein VGG16_11495 [Streptosporangiaceae bacterium]